MVIRDRYTLSVLVHVVHLESHGELLLGVVKKPYRCIIALRGHRYGDEEVGEVDAARLVHVEDLDHVAAELVCFGRTTDTLR
jgi:hypothetical protein